MTRSGRNENWVRVIALTGIGAHFQANLPDRDQNSVYNENQPGFTVGKLDYSV